MAFGLHRDQAPAWELEILKWGFPCSHFLNHHQEILGYKVADFPETVELMQESWLAFIQDETKIDSVIYRYRKLGFNACCDLPGNTFYKELYDNIPNCKVELLNKL